MIWLVLGAGAWLALMSLVWALCVAARRADEAADVAHAELERAALAERSHRFRRDPGVAASSGDVPRRVAGPRR